MACRRCSLPDIHNGAGDGIGSCDCPRCQCCGASPDECECRRDWDAQVDGDEDWDSVTDQPLDTLCNDPGCEWREYRIERAKAARAEA